MIIVKRDCAVNEILVLAIQVHLDTAQLNVYGQFKHGILAENTMAEFPLPCAAATTTVADLVSPDDLMVCALQIPFILCATQSIHKTESCARA